LAEPRDQFGELELPETSPSLPPPAAAADLEVDPFAAAAPRPPAAPAFAAPPDPGLVRQAGGGTSYGEVNLDGGESPASTANNLGDDMEFGAIPEEPAKAPAANGEWSSF
jgi:hypothetical protein